MNENQNINLSEIELKNMKENQIKPKRIEWLNFFSKGFIVQSINNGYKNENIKIKKSNKKKLQIKRNIIPRNLTTIILNQEISNKSNINSSNLSSKKTDFSLLISDEKDKNKLYTSYISNIKNILTEQNYNKINNKKKIINENKNLTEKKDIKKNKHCSVKNSKNIKHEKNQIKEKKTNNNNKNKHKSIKMNSKIILKKDIHSPLLNYLDYIKKNANKNIFNLINNKQSLNKKDNNNINSNSKISLNISINQENNGNKNKNKRNKYKLSKSIKEIKINNINLIEVQKYMLEGRKFKNNKNSYGYNGYNNDYKGEIGDYTFDDEEEEKLSCTDRKNIITFSDIYNPINNFMTGNKKELNELYDEIIKKKENKKQKLDSIKQLLEFEKV